MTEAAYEALIAKAFIDPIRSVLIVDDDYPTLNEILAEGEDEKRYEAQDKKWRRDKASVRRVLDEFRDPKAPLLLDIHDGTLPSERKDEEGADELQQTDLLILDYQLERGADDGDQALKIARRTLSNEHFNLILVHTEKELDDVFYEFVTGLYPPAFQKLVEQDGNEAVDSFEAEYGDEFDTVLSLRHWARALQEPRAWTGKLCGEDPEWEAPRRILERATEELQDFNRGRDWRTAVLRVLARREAERPEYDETRPIRVLDWRDDGVRFIRTDRGFMAFRSKNDDSSTPLLESVKAALAAWKPRPSRLLLTKLRAEMNKRGIEVQDDALGDPHVGAIWYRELLDTDDAQRNAAVDRTVRNHAERLLDQITPGVHAFAEELLALDHGVDRSETVRKRFGINLDDDDQQSRAVLGHNAFVGSKPISGFHLELGHILKIRTHYWLCVTPACDMVPGRSGGAKRPDKGLDLRRFSAVRLYEQDEAELLKTAARGGRIFANVLDGNGSTGSKAFRMAFADTANPASMTMYVEQDGVLNLAEGRRACFVRYADFGGTTPAFTREEALLVAHLRPEYALDIQARFTGSQSRIGLDFMAHPDGDDASEDDK